MKKDEFNNLLGWGLIFVIIGCVCLSVFVDSLILYLDIPYYNSTLLSIIFTLISGIIFLVLSVITLNKLDKKIRRLLK